MLIPSNELGYITNRAPSNVGILQEQLNEVKLAVSELQSVQSIEKQLSVYDHYLMSKLFNKMKPTLLYNNPQIEEDYLRKYMNS